MANGILVLPVLALLYLLKYTSNSQTHLWAKWVFRRQLHSLWLRNISPFFHFLVGTITFSRFFLILEFFMSTLSMPITGFATYYEVGLLSLWFSFLSQLSISCALSGILVEQNWNSGSRILCLYYPVFAGDQFCQGWHLSDFSITVIVTPHTLSCFKWVWFFAWAQLWPPWNLNFKARNQIWTDGVRDHPVCLL